MTMQIEGATRAGGDHRCYELGDFVLDIDRAVLLRNGEDVPLRPKSMAVLLYLVERPGVLVSKAELLQGVWRGLVVSDDSLTQCMIDVRRALGDDDKEMVSTVRGRGYRLELDVVPFVTGLRASALHTFAVDRLKSARWLLVVFAAVLLAGTWFAVWWSRASSTPSSGASAAGPIPALSIAVLAFEDMSQAGGWEYFGDGLAEEVIHQLARIQRLRVTAWTSSFTFKGRQDDVAAIAEQLQVSYVLQGSVRADGDKVRVTAQLVGAGNSGQLWSGAYTRARDDTFGLQIEIAKSVAEALELTLLATEQDHRDSVAWEYYLRGRFLHHRRGEGDPQRALALFEQALERNPDMVEAWLGLASSLLVLAWDGERRYSEVMNDVRSALNRALMLDPDNAEALVRLGACYYFIDFDPIQARQYFSLALEYGPNEATVIAIIGAVEYHSQNFERGIELLEKAIAMDPLSALYRNNLGFYYLQNLQLEAARRELAIALELNPDDTDFIHKELARILVLERRYEEAWRLADTLEDALPRQQLHALIAWGQGSREEWAAAVSHLEAQQTLDAAVMLVEVYALAGDYAAVFHWLDILGARYLNSGEVWRHRQHIDDARFSPFLVSLRQDTRLQQWGERMDREYRERSLAERH